MSSACSIVTLGSSTEMRLRMKLRIENHAQSRQLCNRLEDDVAVIRHLQLIGFARAAASAAGGPGSKSSFSGFGLIFSGVLAAFFVGHQLHRFLDFLRGGHVRRVTAFGLLEFGERHFQIALFEQLFALFEMEIAVHRVHAHSAQLVFGVRRIGTEGAFVVDQRGIVVLNGFRLAASFEILICLGATRQNNPGERQEG